MMRDPLADPARFIADMADEAALGIDLIEAVPIGDPVAFVSEFVERVVSAPLALGR
ncbi:MAG: hypothetical protein R3F35_09335 [Myxococcota bacterium]